MDMGQTWKGPVCYVLVTRRDQWATSKKEVWREDNSAVLHVGLCPARGVLCMLHSAGPLPAEPFERMMLLAKDTADAVGAEIRKCLEKSVEKRAAKRVKLVAASNASDAAGASI